MEQIQIDKKSTLKQTVAYLLLYAAGIALYALTMLLGETEHGRPALRLFWVLLDIRLPCAVLWVLGIGGIYEWGKIRKDGLAIVIAMAFLAMALCIAMYGRSYSLIIYLSVGILILFARREGYEKGRADHAILAVVYFAVPAAVLILEMMDSTYLVSSFAVWADPKTDPQGQGYLYLMVKQLLAGAQLIGKSPYAAQSGFSPEQLFRSDLDEYALSGIIAGYGWAAGIVILLLLAALSVALIRSARMIPDGRGRSAALGCALFFTVQLVVSAAGNFLLLPFRYASPIPFLSCSIESIIGEAILGGTVLCLYIQNNIASP